MIFIIGHPVSPKHMLGILKFHSGNVESRAMSIANAFFRKDFLYENTLLKSWKNWKSNTKV